MDEYMALREVEATARFCELVLAGLLWRPGARVGGRT